MLTHYTRLFNFVVSRATPNMLATVGNAGYGTYFIFGSFCFSMWFFAFFLVPETKGISLEAMDEIFGTVCSFLELYNLL